MSAPGPGQGPGSRRGAIRLPAGFAGVSRPVRRLLSRLRKGLSRRRRIRIGVETAARIGYGARGFVYLSVGILTLLAVLDLMDDAVGTRGAIAWLAKQPFGRGWLLLLGLGLTAFTGWRLLQAVFDADREGRSWRGLKTRFTQAVSGLGYMALAITAFSLLAHTPADPAAAEIVRGRQEAERILSLPYGDWLLIGVGLGVAGVGIAHVVRAWRTNFTAYLVCSARLCRRVAPLARVGYVARGLAWLPLAALIFLSGLRSEASQVTSFGGALDVLERQPAGSWLLASTALGFVAFGVFSFVEARFRRIRPPDEIVSG